jgi:hypothetical protein
VALPLPRSWWTEPSYLEALLHWHRVAWTDAYTTLHWRAHRLAGGAHWGNAGNARFADAAYVAAVTGQTVPSSADEAIFDSRGERRA